MTLFSACLVGLKLRQSSQVSSENVFDLPFERTQMGQSGFSFRKFRTSSISNRKLSDGKKFNGAAVELVYITCAMQCNNHELFIYGMCDLSPWGCQRWNSPDAVP